MKDIVAVGKGMRRRARRHGLAGLAVLGAVVIAGVVAGWGVSPGGTVEISPADVVALRFPPDWNDDATADTTASAPAAPSQSFALASAESRQVDANVLFSPRPTLALPAGTTALAPTDEPQATVPRTPAKVETKSESKAAAKPESKPATHTAATRSLAATAHPAPHARKDSGMLFNDAQLANIKSRLKLSAYQEQYWPPVEYALRQIGWRAAHDAGHAGNSRAHLAEIDPDSPEVQQLKSAAFPLIMSMNDDQKREVRMLAQVMGLERVAASF